MTAVLECQAVSDCTRWRIVASPFVRLLP